MDRYQELKKENNDIYIYFGESYKRIAIEYVKRARKFGIRKEDTELKIRETLYEIKDLDERLVNPNVAIPSVDIYIDEKLKKISKRYIDKNQIIGFIIALVLIIVSVGWFVYSRYLSRQASLNTPNNFSGYLSGTRVYLTWNEVDFAGNYKIYYEIDNSSKSSTYTIYETNTSFNLDKGHIYTFHLYASGSDYILDSKETIFTIEIPN